MNDKMESITYAELLRTGTGMIREAAVSKTAVSDASIDAWYLMEHVFKIDRASYYLRMNDQISDQEEERVLRYLELAKRRASGEPLQYITGSASFMGMDLYVDPSVLIPRQDTEVLAEKAIELLKEGDHVLDMCSGSGCIILSLAYHFPHIKGTGADISSRAVEIGRLNRDRLGLAQVDFIESDLFENINGEYDLIVSNPPYIRTDDIEELDAEVKLHEPVLALDGSPDGLIFYRRLALEAYDHLREGAVMLLEIGMDQAEDVTGILAAAGYTGIEVIKDLSGLDRVIMCQKP